MAFQPSEQNDTMGIPASILEQEAPAPVEVVKPLVKPIPRRGATQDWCYASLLEAITRAHGYARTQAERGQSPEPERVKPAFKVVER